MNVKALTIGFCFLLSAATQAAEPKGVAVVELFTSEGCSSCPPAEAAAAALEASASKSAHPVYVLAFHVDYWNNLGWKDRFSNAAFTQRQYAYARQLKLESVYTPQMIVNGSDEFVGSDRVKAQNAITAALTQTAPVKVDLTAQVSGLGKITLAYEVKGAAESDLVNAAVVEDGLTTKVLAGENAGSRLEHPAVVRWFATCPAGKEGRGSATANLPDVALPNAHVIIFVQDARTLAVRGAAGRCGEPAELIVR